jgi:thymidylate synthase (FAD)
MHVELLHITPDALAFIGKCAGICYGSSTERELSIKRAVSCKDKGHLATLRFAHATFHVSGVSRICSHQFVRSKHLDFLQRSQRYCKEDEAQFVYPGTKEDFKISGLFQKAQAVYNELLAAGVKKEDARFVLPEGTATELIVTGNLQAWLDFIRLRSGPEAQREIREVAITINNILSEHCPGLFNWIPTKEQDTCKN